MLTSWPGSAVTASCASAVLAPSAENAMAAVIATATVDLLIEDSSYLHFSCGGQAAGRSCATTMASYGADCSVGRRTMATPQPDEGTGPSRASCAVRASARRRDQSW